jgi:hypothetical protein
MIKMNLIERIKNYAEVRRESAIRMKLAIQREFELQSESKRLYEQFFDVFGHRDNTYYLEERKNNPAWKSYTEKTMEYYTYSLYRDYAQGAAQEVVRGYIKDIVKTRMEGKVECSDAEILGLTAIMEYIEDTFTAGMIFHPFPIGEAEDNFFNGYKQDLPEIVNSLVKHCNVDPFETEKRLKDLYYLDDIRFLGRGWRFTAAVDKLLHSNPEQGNQILQSDGSSG